MFGVNVKLQDVGRVDVRLPGANKHIAKSIAGTLFHGSKVISTCVFDENGNVPLYLKKTANGVYREEE
jgi:hypothetical protein